MTDRPTPAEVIDDARCRSDYRPHVPMGEDILAALAEAGYQVVPDTYIGPAAVARLIDQRNRAVRALAEVRRAGVFVQVERATRLLDEDWAQAVLDDD